ncbi:hypothetical protein QLF84_25075, partial [Salmonella enterica subsp. enterica serovar Oslo]|uniref:hypothetical protein n=1 Tax=Salmonella enterica TaxID=28901 RepID=UPI00288D46B8
LTALTLGTLLYFVAAKRLSSADEAPVFLSAVRGQQIFERLMLVVTRKWPTRLYRIVGSPRLQLQLRLIVLLSLGATAATLWGA